MTKDELLVRLLKDDSPTYIELTLNEFFDSNVVIPKGSNSLQCDDIEAPNSCSKCKWLDQSNRSEYQTYKCCNPIGGMLKWQSLTSYCSDYDRKDSHD